MLDSFDPDDFEGIWYVLFWIFYASCAYGLWRLASWASPAAPPPPPPPLSPPPLNRCARRQQTMPAPSPAAAPTPRLREPLPALRPPILPGFRYDPDPAYWRGTHLDLRKPLVADGPRPTPSWYQRPRQIFYRPYAQPPPPPPPPKAPVTAQEYADSLAKLSAALRRYDPPAPAPAPALALAPLAAPLFMPPPPPPPPTTFWPPGYTPAASSPAPTYPAPPVRPAPSQPPPWLASALGAALAASSAAAAPASP